MINHAEAQSLVSARMDEPLDPIVARELDAHLATCPQCRAFAMQTAAMSQALHDLPRLPASPRVRRDVLDTIQKPQTPWTRFQGILAPGPGSAFSTVAAVLVVGLLSVFVLTRLLGNDDNGGNQTTLQAPSVETTRESDVAQANPTATESKNNGAAPTATTANTQVPTEPALTGAAPTDVVLTESAPTETPPTDVAPTEAAPTEAPPTEVAPTDAVPTETVAQAQQPTEVPTDVPAPTEVASRSNMGDGGSNAIVIAGEAATSPEAETQVPTEPVLATETVAPIETPASTEPLLPTETLAPTETAVPTETVAPTETPVPPTPQPTQTPVVDSPPIESTTGTYASADQGDSTPSEIESGATTAPQPTDGAPPIEPMGTQPDDGAAPTIGPADETPGQDQTVPNDGTGGASTSIPGAEDTSTPDGGNQSSDPGSSLGPVDPSTRIEASGGSWAPSSTALAPESSPDGVTIASDRQGDLTACTADGSCQPIASEGTVRPSSTPIGWIGSTLIYAADSGEGGVTYHAISISADGTPGDDVVLGSGGASTGNAYVFGDGLLIETDSGWFLATPSDGQSISAFAAGANRQQVRLYPASNRVVSVVDGSILIESLDNGEVLARVPAKAVDFDLSSDGQQLVVSTGSSIQIWNIYDSSPSVTYAPPSGDQIGSVAWSGDSILYVDVTTGEVRSIAASDFGPRS